MYIYSLSDNFIDKVSYSGNLLQEEMFVNHTIMLSEQIFAIFAYYVYKRKIENLKYIENIWIHNVC